MACSCEAKKYTLKANLSAGASKKTIANVEYLIVPVVMLRQTVVNGAYVDINELVPAAWNGVPVTLQHPMEGGKPVSANSPHVLAQWQVGTIFNAKMEGDKLMAEAWIDIAKVITLNQQALLVRLESGEPMDVSTGYFADHTEVRGVYNGKEYVETHQGIKPDHLALLPDVQGACNWSDGCGVRANQSGGPVMKVKELFVALAQAMGVTVNVEVGMTKQEMVDLLIKNKAAEESEREGLMALSEKNLTLMTNAFPPKKDAKEELDPKTGKPVVPPVAANSAAPVIDANAIAAIVLEQLKAQAPAINADDRAAIDAAKGIVANARAATIARIVANSKMTAESLKDMSDAQLQVIADGLPIATNFGGRAVPLINDVNTDKEELKAMSGVSDLTALIKARNGGDK